MEWNDNEKKIISRLQQHTESLDTESLWNGIKPNLPVRKKNNWLPLLFFFLSGIGLGIGGYHILTKNQPSPEAKELLDWQTEKSVLLKELTLCKQSKQQDPQVYHPFNNELQNNSILPGSTTTTLANAPSKHHILSPEIPEGTTSYSPSDNYQILSQIAQPGGTKTKADDEDTDITRIENKNIILFKNNIPLLIQPIISIETKPEKTKLLPYVLGGGGVTYIWDKQVVENNSQKTKHTPMYHYNLEYGFQKRWKNNWFMNVGLNYTGLASHIRYHFTKNEDFLLTDTTGYYIGPDGIISTETGEVIATKITQKRGKTYNYCHYLILHPNIEYDIPINMTSSVSVRLGAMVPMVSWHKTSFLNAEGGVQRLPSGFQYFETPFLSGGIVYNKIVNEKTLGIYLDFLLGSQNIRTGTHITARTFFLPQTGMRIIF